MDAGGELPNSKLSFRDHLVLLEKNGSNKNKSQESTERAVLRWIIAAPLLFQPNLSMIY